MNAQELLPEFTRILAEHDLEGLIKMGCPDDEYQPEAERILPKLKGEPTVNEVAAITRDVFAEMFGCPERDYEMSVQDCLAVAADLREAWLKKKPS